MSNRLTKTILILLIVISLIGAIAIYFLMQNHENGKKGPSIDDIIEASVDVNEITTNLASENFVKMSFKIQTDSKSAKEELTKRDFQVRNIMIEELSDINAEDLKGKSGKIKLEESLKTRINKVMQEGKVVKIYITESLLQ